MSEDLQCCLCKEQFTSGSQPRMMPHCEHSCCTPCLQNLLSDSTPSIIQCQHCGHSQTLEQTDLEYFPKNISLHKATKHKLPSTSPPTELPLIGSESSLQRELCALHGKELELICLSDREKVCPHCALFGQHKNHTLKPISEVEAQMREIECSFREVQEEKEAIDNRIGSREFQQEVVRKIGAEKERVVSEIREKFTLLYDNVRLAEKQAFEDVVKNFRSIYQTIISLIKEESDYQVRFKAWQKNCRKWLAEAVAQPTLEQRVALFFGGPLESCKEGSSIVKQIEQKVEQSLAVTEQLIASIRIKEDSSVANSIFNYIHVETSINNLGITGHPKPESVHPRCFPASPTSILLNPLPSSLDSPFASSLTSSSQRHTTPRGKSGSRDKQLNRTSERKKAMRSPQNVQKNKASLEKAVEEFIERVNLDTLDLSAYGLSDEETVKVLRYLRPLKKVKGLKLVKNKLTSGGVSQVLGLLPDVTNLNLSFNELTQQALGVILSCRKEVPFLRIINVSNNKINQRKAKGSLQQLRRQGIIVTI